MMRFSCCVALITIAVSSGVAGDLSPPGAPAPTSTLGLPPATPITAIPITIEESGPYYLTGNFTVASDSANGITVRADDVVIDLGGFSLTGPSTGTGLGVSAEAAVGVTVRNGTIREFGSAGAILGEFGLAEDLRIENCPLGLGLLSGGCARRVHATGCETSGVSTIFGCTLIDCSVFDCGVGIFSIFGSGIIRCSVLGSQSIGVVALGPMVVSDCRVTFASGEAYRGSSGTVFENCTAFLCHTGFLGDGGVTIRDCTASVCSVEGIAVGGASGSSLIVDCRVEDSGVGIRVDQTATILRNYVSDSSSNSILISATDVTVLDNVLMDAPSAITHTGVGEDCLYARNAMTFGANLGAMSTYGPLVTGSGNLNDDAGSDHPWANIFH